MKTFRTYELAKQFYKDASKLRFKKEIQEQFDRAILSIVLNLAEGTAKPTEKDRMKFYSSAMGSFREVQAILELTNQTALLAQSNSLGAHLYRLTHSKKAVCQTGRPEPAPVI